MSIKERVALAKAEKDAMDRYERLMESGKFTNTGKQYDASEAVADSENAALRMTARIENGKLQWAK